MKIAVFTDAYYDAVGGIVSSIRAQKQALEAEGHKVVVFGPGFLGPKESIVPTCRFFKATGMPVAKNPRKVEKWVKQMEDFREFDLVHVHYEAGCSLAGMRLARKFKKPLIVTMHGREDAAVSVNIPWGFRTLTGTVMNLAHALYLPHKTRVKKDGYLASTSARAKMWEMMVNHANYADLVLTPSQHFKKKLRHYGVTKPIKVVSNGVADKLVERKVPVRELKAGDSLKLVWASRISREKRMLEFLKALALVEVPVEMVAFGNGNELKKAKRFAQKMGLKVDFRGTSPQKEIFEEMKRAHLSVLASYDFDNQSVALLEAEAAGLPVFICDPDQAEVVASGGQILADGPGAKEMAAALEKLYRQPEKIRAMSEEMIKHRDEIKQSRVLKDLVKIYTARIKK